MRSRILAVMALVSLVAVAPAWAQTLGAPADKTGSVEQPVNHVTGSVVSVSGNRLEIKVQPAAGTSPTAAGPGLAENLTFTLASETEKPADVRVGDAVEVWYRSEGAALVATRVAWSEAASASASSGSMGGSPEPAGDASAVSASESMPAGSQKGTLPANPQKDAVPGSEPAGSSVGSTGSEPSTGIQPASQGSVREHLPKTASDLPLIGLIGLAGLAGAVALRGLSRD